MVYRDINCFEHSNLVTSTISTQFSILKSVFSYGYKNRIININPLDRHSAEDFGGSVKVRRNFFAFEDIGILWLAITRIKHLKRSKFMQLLTIFGARTTELRIAKISDFDFEKNVWTIPPENHKTGGNGEVKQRAIPELAKDIIEDLDYGQTYLFESLVKVGQPLNRRFCEDALSDLKKNLGDLNHRLANDFINHDLRRTCRTAWEFDLEFDHIVCEEMLGHEVNQ
ncbi:tyrosine-type recombinase/integrase [Vibrio sp. SS-MA-C1-2]|uniref:tyrosine-type recombinase/integrase n=1 Tax=Vibrio sp. SS-MA-C1-2 TaxID=2908646 RepID=UPI001F469BDC|nr:tyrosine-type recombinase/integrase [Vibrio sp. SS-MA-C1-2]UJF17626.1 tyrosine-type recombinase/integrase [Vibrio sp. SS-MA-C1-2]